MTITLITDCQDANAAGRQAVRLAGLFNTTPIIIGVKSDLEAAGNLIDALDAAEDRPGVYLVNVAPRNGQAKKWPNGTPFSYFRYKQSLILSSIDGLALSLIKKFNLTPSVRILDIPSACEAMIKDGALLPALAEAIRTTQFRSFEFLPRVARFLAQGHEIAGEDYVLTNVAEAPQAIWWIDNFGNAKTTLFTQELSLEKNAVPTAFGPLPYFTHLSDVPDQTTALTTGSSGLGEQRFVELVIQGESAAKKYTLTTGQGLFDTSVSK